jgi:hypothetical protein
MASSKLVLRTKGYVVGFSLWTKRVLVLGGPEVEARWLNEDVDGSSMMMMMMMILSHLDILRCIGPAASST